MAGSWTIECVRHRRSCKVMVSGDPPLRLLLESDALRRTEGELVGQRADIDSWGDVTRSTDYPG